MIGMAAIAQFWEWPKSEIRPIPTKPMQIQFSKEMLAQNHIPDAGKMVWPDPNLWMLSSEGLWSRLEKAQPLKPKK